MPRAADRVLRRVVGRRAAQRPARRDVGADADPGGRQQGAQAAPRPVRLVRRHARREVRARQAQGRARRAARRGRRARPARPRAVRRARLARRGGRGEPERLRADPGADVRPLAVDLLLADRDQKGLQGRRRGQRPRRQRRRAGRQGALRLRPVVGRDAAHRSGLRRLGARREVIRAAQRRGRARHAGGPVDRLRAQRARGAPRRLDRHGGDHVGAPALAVSARDPDRHRQPRRHRRRRARPPHPRQARGGPAPGRHRSRADQAGRRPPGLGQDAVIWTPAAIFRLVALCLVGGIFQLTAVSQFTIFGVPADLSPLLAASVGLLAGSIAGAAFGFSLGLFMDTALLQTLGLTSLVLLTLGYLAGRLRELRDPGHGRVPLAVGPAATAASVFGLAIMQFLLGFEAPVSLEFVRHALMVIVLNSLLALPVYALVRRVLLPFLPDDPRRRRRRAYTTGGLSPLSRT